MHFQPLDGACSWPFRNSCAQACCGGLDPEIIRAELFGAARGVQRNVRPRAGFVDGHQHAQLFPQVRDAFLSAVKQAAPNAWYARADAISRSFAASHAKALLLDVLSAQFRRRAARAGIAFNPGFAGAYDFAQEPDFGMLMRQFLAELRSTASSCVIPDSSTKSSRASTHLRPSASTNMLSRRREFPRYWRQAKLRWADIAQKPARASCRIRKFNS